MVPFGRWKEAGGGELLATLLPHLLFFFFLKPLLKTVYFGWIHFERSGFISLFTCEPLCACNTLMVVIYLPPFGSSLIAFSLWDPFLPISLPAVTDEVCGVAGFRCWGVILGNRVKSVTSILFNNLVQKGLRQLLFFFFTPMDYQCWKLRNALSLACLKFLDGAESFFCVWRVREGLQGEEVESFFGNELKWAKMGTGETISIPVRVQRAESSTVIEWPLCS